MADYLTTDTELASIANAIRTKGGTSAQLTYPAGFVSAIEAIPTGGGTSTADINVYLESGKGDDPTVYYIDDSGDLQSFTPDVGNNAITVMCPSMIAVEYGSNYYNQGDITEVSVGWYTYYVGYIYGDGTVGMEKG